MKKVILMACAVVLSACVNNPNQNFTTTAQNTGVGAAIGAGIGNLVGKDSEATATGAAIGGAIGAVMQTGNWGLGGNQPQQPYHSNQGYPQGYNQPVYNQPTYNQPAYNQYPQNNGAYRPRQY